jgi:hypothetical protein
MRLPHIGLGAQNLNGIQRYSKAGSNILDEYYNSS